jgi:hypothetical protein
MNLTAQDIARLRWSLIFLGAALLAGGGLGYFLHQQVGRAEQTRRQLTAQQQEIRGRLNHARDEEQDMRGRIDRYQRILASGWIGQEERLDWVEQIARIKAARRLLDVQYELSPQHAIEESVLPGGSAAGGYEFMASTMKLHLALLDENDLLGFLDDLRAAVHAHLLIRTCSIDRAPTAIADRGPPAQLQAECLIDWVTLREKQP